MKKIINLNYFSAVSILFALLIVSGCGLKNSQNLDVKKVGDGLGQVDAVKNITEEIVNGEIIEPVSDDNQSRFFSSTNIQKDASKVGFVKNEDENFSYSFTVYSFSESDPAINGNHLAIYVEAVDKKSKNTQPTVAVFDIGLNVLKVNNFATKNNIMTLNITEEFFSDETDKDLPEKRTAIFEYQYNKDKNTILILPNDK